jgi:hypothetical protein
MANPLRLVCPKCRTVDRLKLSVRPGATLTCSRCGGAMAVPEPAAPSPPIGQTRLAGSPDDKHEGVRS